MSLRGCPPRDPDPAGRRMDGETDVKIEGEGCDTGERDALDLQLELL